MEPEAALELDGVGGRLPQGGDLKDYGAVVDQDRAFRRGGSVSEKRKKEGAYISQFVPMFFPLWYV